MQPKIRLNGLSVVALVALVSACSSGRPVTSEPEFLPGGSTPHLGGMPGSEGPIGPAYYPEASGRSTELPAENDVVVQNEPLPPPATNRSQIDRKRVSIFEENKRRSGMAKKSQARATRKVRTTGASVEPRVKRPALSEAQKLWQKELALNQLHHINQKEMRMSQMALDKTENAQVKAMATKILADHQKIESRVKAVAESENIPLHSYQTATHEAAFVDRWEKMEGKDFDQAFLASMKTGHDMAIGDLKIVERSAHDPEVAALIRGAMPSIRQHDRMTTGASRRW